MKKFLGYFLIFLLGAASGIGGILLYNQYQVSQPSGVSREKTKEEKTDNKFILKKSLSASLVWWDQDNGFESIKENKDKIQHLKLFWYEAKNNGSITKYSGAEDKEIIEFAKKNNILLLATLTNDHDPEKVHDILHNADIRATHINNLIDLMEKNDYDGLDINYESLNGNSDREAYSNFMIELAKEVHAKDKILFTALHAKTDAKGLWEGPEAQDWVVLAEHCDLLKIMTYDYHWETSEAGDIAPISWIRDVLEYAVEVIPKEKIQLGIHFYGYDWINEQAKGLTYNDVQELIQKYNPTISLSDEKEKYFTYTKDSDKHTVYFTDNETVSERLNLVPEFEIGGIGIWRLGQEDLLNWQKIEEILG